MICVCTGTSIGKRYARTDAIGVPFAITVDAQTLEDNTVTLRERDSTAQVRADWLLLQRLFWCARLATASLAPCIEHMTWHNPCTVTLKAADGHRCDFQSTKSHMSSSS